MRGSANDDSRLGDDGDGIGAQYDSVMNVETEFKRIGEI
jgi:hypothetical protein